jgi:myosin heavy subunit
VNVDSSGKIMSATIRNYLLEKSRIVHQNSDERNFHIFYYVFIDPAISEVYKLSKPEDYAYLRNSFIDAIPEEEDQMGWKIMQNWMKVLGFTNDEYNEIIDLVVGILNLGNIQFGEEYIGGKGDHSFITSDSEKYLHEVSKLFGIEDSDFIEKVRIS